MLVQIAHWLIKVKIEHDGLVFLHDLLLVSGRFRQVVRDSSKQRRCLLVGLGLVSVQVLVQASELFDDKFTLLVDLHSCRKVEDLNILKYSHNGHVYPSTT